MSLYDRVRDLPLTVEGYALDGLEQHVSSGFLRKTTVIHLHGGGEEGVGEDVTYDGGRARSAAGARARSCRSTAQLDARHVLAPSRDAPALRPRARAARVPRLSPLGLRERRARPGAAAGGTLARRRRRQDAASRSRSSSRRGSASRRRPTACAPGSASTRRLRFKLDATADWTDELIAELAATRLRSTPIDFKGQYTGTSVDTAPDAELYRRGDRRASRGVARGSRPHPGDGRGARAAPRPRHLGRRRSTPSPTSRRCAGRRGRST